MSVSASPVCPCEKPGDDLTIMRRLCFKDVVCNCTRFPEVGRVIIDHPRDVSDMMGHIDLEDSDCVQESGEGGNDLDQDQSDNVQVESDESTEVMRMKGSSFHEHFQRHLKICKELFVNNEKPEVRFFPEPMNMRDENAILLQAKIALDTSAEKKWLAIGYVPGIKVPKVTLAIRNNELKVVSLKNVYYQYVPVIGQFKYFPSVAATKTGKWASNKLDYKYNEKI